MLEREFETQSAKEVEGNKCQNLAKKSWSSSLPLLFNGKIHRDFSRINTIPESGIHVVRMLVVHSGAYENWVHQPVLSIGVDLRGSGHPAAGKSYLS